MKEETAEVMSCSVAPVLAVEKAANRGIAVVPSLSRCCSVVPSAEACVQACAKPAARERSPPTTETARAAHGCCDSWSRHAEVSRATGCGGLEGRVRTGRVVAARLAHGARVRRPSGAARAGVLRAVRRETPPASRRGGRDVVRHCQAEERPKAHRPPLRRAVWCEAAWCRGCARWRTSVSRELRSKVVTFLSFINIRGIGVYNTGTSKSE